MEVALRIGAGDGLVKCSNADLMLAGWSAKTAGFPPLSGKCSQDCARGWDTTGVKGGYLRRQGSAAGRVDPTPATGIWAKPQRRGRIVTNAAHSRLTADTGVQGS